MHFHPTPASASGDALAGYHAAETAIALRRARELRDSASKIKIESLDFSSVVAADPDAIYQTVSMVSAWSGGGAGSSQAGTAGPTGQTGAVGRVDQDGESGQIGQTGQISQTGQLRQTRQDALPQSASSAFESQPDSPAIQPVQRASNSAPVSFWA